MFDERDLKLDLLALALLVLVVFLALALFSYNPADPLGDLVWPLSSIYQADALVHPPGTEITNACGFGGALAADLLLNALGLGAYYLVVSLAVLDVFLLMRREIDSPVLRTLGWIGSLVGITTLVAMLVPGLSPGPVIGSGGYLGAVSRSGLEAHFAFAGGLILAVSLLVGGLLLSTDYVLVRLTVLACGLAISGVSRGGRLVVGRATGKSNDRSPAGDNDEQLEEEDEEESQDDSLSVRIRGKQIDPQAADDEDQGQAESGESHEELEDDEEEEPVFEEPDQPDEPDAAKRKSATGRFKSRLSTALQIKRPPEQSREEVMEQLEAASTNDEPTDYELPSLDMLLKSERFDIETQEKDVRRKAKVLEKTFASFGFQVKVVEIDTGPVIAQYEVELESGLRLSRIANLADDLAIALRVPSVRIVAPIPGKNTVGIEVPNHERQLVRLREVMEEAGGRAKNMRIPIFLGKDVSGNPLLVDLSTLPHLLIAGRTGTGKSVCLNAIIASLLMTRRPDEVRMLMIDPKMVELSCYKRLPHLMHPVVTEMRKAEAILAWAVEKMEERYELLAKAGVRHVSVYNQLGEEELMDRLQPEDDEQRQAIPLHLPYIVIVADEIADLMMTSGKEVELHIIRLAQKSRAVGIHLILATQKPTVDVITGLIKSNLPARISFQVASRTDSRVVLDEMGADKLLGNGDMLFLWPGTSTLIRGQGTYLSDDEISSIVDFVSTDEQNFVTELVQLKVEDPGDAQAGTLKRRDDLYEAAVDIVVREGRGSVSLLQRTLGIGYGRAARLIDYMDEDGVVGPYAGSQAREVLVTLEEWEQMQHGQPERQAAATVAAPKLLTPPRLKDVDEREPSAAAVAKQDIVAKQDSASSRAEQPPPWADDDEQSPVEEDTAQYVDTGQYKDEVEEEEIEDEEEEAIGDEDEEEELEDEGTAQYDIEDEDEEEELEDEDDYDGEAYDGEAYDEEEEEEYDDSNYEAESA